MNESNRWPAHCFDVNTQHIKKIQSEMELSEHRLDTHFRPNMQILANVTGYQ